MTCTKDGLPKTFIDGSARLATKTSKKSLSGNDAIAYRRCGGDLVQILDLLTEIFRSAKMIQVMILQCIKAKRSSFFSIASSSLRTLFADFCPTESSSNF